MTKTSIAPADILTNADFDIAVVGAGPAGLIAACAAAKLGVKTALIGPKASATDGRSVAMFEGGVQLLRNIGVWAKLSGSVARLDAIRLVDGTDAMMRAPEVTFRASEIGCEAFGYSVPTAALTTVLEDAATAPELCHHLTRIETSAITQYAIESQRVILTTPDGETVSARLIVAADGRASPARAAAQIATKAWSYPQSAVVTSFTHTVPHRRISTEFHRRAGPLTVVPGPTVGGRDTSSLVWVDTPAICTDLAQLSDAEFMAALFNHVGSVLGRLSDVGPRRVFPLSGQSAETMGQNRIALVGEAGHVMPPIGAQGLNLSLRDAADLVERVAAAKSSGQDVGSDRLLAAYNAARSPDITGRVWSVDLLNRSLFSPYLPVHLMRGAGLYALSTIGPLRRRLMREGMMPDAATPALMRNTGSKTLSSAV